MAEPRGPEGTDIVKLQRYVTTRGNVYSYIYGKFLSIEDIFSSLAANEHRHESEEIMQDSLNKVQPHYFLHMQVSIPVCNLQHVTEEDAVRGIIKQEAFKITTCDNRPEFRHILFWSAEISPEDLASARQQAYNSARRVISSLTYEQEIKNQFGNSPAFNKSASRYGNFKFSFPLVDLLSLYKSQYCEGEEPQMRILGTETYRNEIAHYVLVHSPDNDNFSDLRSIPTNQPSSGTYSVVYWEDGKLFWRPESTSIALKVKITKEGNDLKECYEPCSEYNRYGTCNHLSNGTYSVWNHLIFAFYLPYGFLKIPEEYLLKNLTVCDADKPYLGKKKLSREKAEKIVQELNEDFKRRRGFL